MNKIYIIEKHGNTEYLNMDALSKKFGISKQTIRKRVREIEAEIGKRYKKQAVINDDRIVLINIFVFMDWLQNRSKLMNKDTRKYVEAFNASDWAEYMGFYNREWKGEDIDKEIKEDT